jgi:hypothetical protein
MKKSFFGLLIILSCLIICSVAYAVPYDDPGGIISRIANKIKLIGIGIAFIGFIASWVISALSLGDEQIINKGKKGATIAVVSGLVLSVGSQIFEWFFA